MTADGLISTRDNSAEQYSTNNTRHSNLEIVSDEGAVQQSTPHRTFRIFWWLQQGDVVSNLDTFDDIGIQHHHRFVTMYLGTSKTIDRFCPSSMHAPRAPLFCSCISIPYSRGEIGVCFSSSCFPCL